MTDTIPAFRKQYKYESQLRETEGTTPDAYPQQWELATKLDTFDDSRPHIACISHHGVWDVKFLLRSELLIVMGMIIDRMGLPFSQNHLVFPVLTILAFQSTTWVLILSIDSYGIANWNTRQGYTGTF